MAQIKNLYRVDYRFENVPFLLRGVMGFLFKKNLKDVVNAFNTEHDLWESSWAAFNTALQDWPGGHDGYMRDHINWFFEGRNFHYDIVKYKLDEDMNRIVGYCPRLKDSKIWVTGKLQ